jgi:predicted lipoprotein with Yx(FWY)xxD motif
MLLRRSFYVTIGLVIAMFVAACGSATTTGSTNSGGSTGNAAIVVKTATATVNGKTATILTNASGMTLYYFTADTATTTACSGSCASMWPPLLSVGSGVPASAAALPGTLNALTDANGSQVTYNGHPLYVYSGDTAPGQTNGEGLFGKWFVATQDLSVQGGGTQPSSTPSGGGSSHGGGYGY